MRVKRALSEDEERLEFFRELPPAEQVRLAMWFHDIVHNGTLTKYEWNKSVDEAVKKAASA